jgi:ubiquitin-like protein Pup
MADQESARGRRKDEPEEIEDIELPDSQKDSLEDIDGLLDEIDSVLEENAEEFVRNYVQKGGE